MRHRRPRSGSAPRNRGARCRSGAAHHAVGGMSDRGRDRSRRPTGRSTGRSRPLLGCIGTRVEHMLYGRIANSCVDDRSTFMTDRFSLDGRVAIITGGGTGIGRGAALVLAEHGADVVLAARRPEPLAATAAEIEALGRRALPVPTDVTSPDQCQELVDTTLREMGRLDILVNNAGGAQTKPI